MTHNRFDGRRPLLALAHGAALSLAFGLSMAHASHIGESLTLDQQFVTSNDKLLVALSMWEKSSADVRAAGIANLMQLAQHRQEQLILLLKQNPTLAAARMMPQSLRAKLPAQAAVLVEQVVRVQGNALAHVSDNFATGQSKSTYKLQGSAGTAALNIYLADPTGSERDLNRMAGKKASFPAMRVGDNLVILDKKQVQLEAAGSTTTSPSSGTAVAYSPTVQGNQNTLSILLNFSDKAISCTPSDVGSRLFGATGSTVNNNYKESSRGLVSFSGQAIGPFTIPYSSTGSCDYAGWATAANSAAKAAGFDTSTYQRVNYVTAGNNSCGWSGLAYMPGQQSWVQSCSTTSVFSHELGHNLSLHHASTPTSEYGDGSDPMGASQSRVIDHNGANRVMAGWMPFGSVQDVSVGGSYALASLSTNTTASSPQVLRMSKADTSEFYYVSLRSLVNLDSTLLSPYSNTLSVHHATGSLPTKTYLVQNLAVGQSFSDATNGITITNQGLSNGTATVGVTLGGGSCLTTSPLVSVSPTSQSSAPGTNVVYNVSVTNANTTACGTGTFNLAQTLPSGFNGSFAASSLSIAAGASVSTTWTAGSPAGTPNGTYTLTASATGSGTGNSAASHASDIVYADNTVPTVSITNPAGNAVVSGNAVIISATALDDIGVQAVQFYVDGVLLSTDTSGPYTVRWNLRKAASGSHTIKVRAVDAAGNAGEQSITVTK